MFFKLFILFTVIPFIELALLIKIGTIIGTLNTILLILVTGVIGALMVRAAGIQCLFRIQNNMQSGIFPADELFNGVLILIAGALLITPGLITDVVGFLLLFPPSREIIKMYLKRYIKSKLDRSPTDISINIQP
jgi:UPF0716 protein FxsA